MLFCLVFHSFFTISKSDDCSSLLPSDSDSHSHSNTNSNEDNNNDNTNVDNDVNVVEEHNSNNSKTEEDSANKMLSIAAEETANTAAATTTATDEPRRDFENATFPGITLDEEGNPVGAWSWPWNEMPLKNGPRCSAKTFDARGPQQKRKDRLVKAAVDACNICRHHNTMGVSVEAKGPRQTKHCPFRLINILFPDTFAEASSEMGDSAKQSAIDADEASNNRGFWIDMQAAFVTTKNNDACNALFFVLQETTSSSKHWH